MSKEYIRDDNKVRRCDSNISKMNMFEYCYYDLFHWNCLRYMCEEIIGLFIEAVKYGFAFLVNVFSLIFLPIYLLIKAVVNIKLSKKNVEYEIPRGKIDIEDFKSKLKDCK